MPNNFRMEIIIMRRYYCAMMSGAIGRSLFYCREVVVRCRDFPKLGVQKGELDFEIIFHRVAY